MLDCAQYLAPREFMITCQACGTANPPTASFCSKCARKLDPETQRAVVRQRESYSATGINWSAVLIATLVILIVAALAGFVVFHGL